MTHIEHKPAPIPVDEANASQGKAMKLKRELMKNYAEESVTAVIKTMDKETVEAVIKNTDEDQIIHDLSSDLSEEIYMEALELLKERFSLVKTCHDEWQNSAFSPPYRDMGTIFLACIQTTIAAEAKRQANETNNS